MSTDTDTICPDCGRWKTESPLLSPRCECSLAPAPGSPPTPTFDVAKSTTNFELTPEEKNYLENLLAWQEQSENSTIILGGIGKVENK